MENPPPTTYPFSEPPATRPQPRGVWASLSFLERALVLLLGLIVVISGAVFISKINERVTSVRPAYGGGIVEGIVGTPRFINPLLAQSDADRELTMLIYSGLMRALPDGSLVTDLAAEYAVNEDGTVYTFTLRPDAEFHDHTKLTAEDVAFTFERAADPSLESPLENVWAGIDVAALDDRTVQFTLPVPYASFLENLTTGILPRHLWANIAVEEFGAHVLNTEPVGSGPFALAKVIRNKSGIPNTYTLRSFKTSTRGRPYLNRIEVRVFANQQELLDAFAANDIDSFDSLDPVHAATLLSEGTDIVSYELPRVFGIFFNQNHNELLTETAVRNALNLAVNKERIVEEVLYGFGDVLEGPLPTHLLAPVPPTAISYEERLAEAAAIMEAALWEKDATTGFYTYKDTTLTLSIATANTPELVEIARLVEEDWKNFGIDVTVEVFDIGQLHREIIRPRAYDALLFGEVVGRDGDLFPFWHSSQRNDPGLNVALYAGIDADAILENLRTTLDPEERTALYASFAEELAADMPAVFLYMPHLLYVPPSHVEGMKIGVVQTPAERFLDVHEWYTQTERVWNIFANTDIE